MIALLGSILAITSVGERLSNRLQAMSLNMEEVAKGDFTRRMGVGTEDEVGRLISYFNQMTGDLADAHRLVNDKTRNLRVALDKMQRLDKAKDDFLALISHEVRTPLTSIIGGIDYLRVVLPGEETEQGQALAKLGVTEIVEIVESSGRRLSEFMNDAILMASLQSADMRVHLEPVAIADICGMVLSSLQEGIAARSLTVENELADTVVLGAVVRSRDARRGGREAAAQRGAAQRGRRTRAHPRGGDDSRTRSGRRGAGRTDATGIPRPAGAGVVVRSGRDLACRGDFQHRSPHPARQARSAVHEVRAGGPHRAPPEGLRTSACRSCRPSWRTTAAASTWRAWRARATSST